MSKLSYKEVQEINRKWAIGYIERTHKLLNEGININLRYNDNSHSAPQSNKSSCPSCQTSTTGIMEYED